MDYLRDVLGRFLKGKEQLCHNPAEIEPRGAGGTGGDTGAGPGDTHIIVVAHVHPTVQHHVLASNGHQDAAPAHVLPGTWTPGKHQKNISKIPAKHQGNTRKIPAKH